MKQLTDKDRLKVREIIGDKLGYDLEEIQPTTDLRDVLGADSLDEVEIVMELEKEFDCIIPDGDYEQATIVADYYDCLQKNMR